MPRPARTAALGLLVAAVAIVLAALPFLPHEAVAPRPPSSLVHGEPAGPAAAAAPASPTARSTEKEVAQCLGRDLYQELAETDPARQRIEAAAAQTRNGQALLWRIAREGRRPSHLFGTIHVSDDRVNDLGPATRAALAGAETVALEVADLSPEALEAAIKSLQHLLFVGDGPSLAGLLDPTETGIARRALERAGMPGGAIEWVRPWVVTMTLSLTECERRRAAAGRKALDQRLGDAARARGVPVVGLETFEDQLGALAAVPADDQLAVLKASLKLEHMKDDTIETLVRLYLSRRLGHAWPLQEELWRRVGFEPNVFGSFRRELIGNRNLGMRRAAMPLLERGAAFIAVGALHLPGEEGLVELLRADGWTVEPVE